MSLLWGGRFESSPDREFLLFSSSIISDAYLWREELLQNGAYAKGLNKAGILSDDELKAIIRALYELYMQVSAGEPFWKREDEDIHSAVERALFEKIGDLAYKIHTGRSRNEQIATDLRLFLKRKIVEINKKISEFCSVLVSLSEANIDVLMPGYTHLQHAQPLRLSQYLLAWFFMLKRDFDRFVSCRKKMDRCPLGSGALAGNSFGIDREYLSELLGFKHPAENSVDAVADRDFVLHFLSQLSNLALHLSRISEEIVLWSTSEFGYIRLPDEFSTGSSLMPQKRNPDSAELVRAAAGRVLGAWVQVATVLKGLPLTYNRDLQEDRVYALDASDHITAALSILKNALENSTFNKERMREALKNENLLATDIADYLVRKGVPFRKAHELTGRLVRLCEKTGTALSEVRFEDLKTISDKFEGDYYQIFNSEQSVETKASAGGTARSAVEDQIKLARKILSKQIEWVEEKIKDQQETFKKIFEL